MNEVDTIQKESHSDIKNESANTCKYFIKRKQRCCKMTIQKGFKFCVQHLIFDDSIENVEDFRITCPLDPKHTCSAKKLDRHLKCCNARIKPEVPYRYFGINSGKCLSEGEPPAFQLKNVTDEDLLLYVKKIDSIYKEYGGIIYDANELSSFVPIQDDRESGLSALRHAVQNDALLALLRQANLLNLTGHKVFVEFGAGRGHLTRWIFEAIERKDDAVFLLVDKASQRNKVDAKFRHRNDIKFKRILMDIQDFHLDDVEDILGDSSLVGCGKHLCGSATDFALRCLTQCRKGHIAGVAVALCCHYRTSWTSYTGKEFFGRIGLTPKDFAVLATLSSWAVDGAKGNVAQQQKNDSTETKISNSEEVFKENRYKLMGLSPATREETGRKAKHILDKGRVDFLKRHNLSARLVRYVDESYTLENIALFAFPEQ